MGGVSIAVAVALTSIGAQARPARAKVVVGGTSTPPPRAARKAQPVPAGCPRLRALCCSGDEACVRPGPARALLLSLGALAGAGAAGILFGLGDRLTNADAATLLVGGGALAGAGALLGIVAGRALPDSSALPERVRRETIGVDIRGSGTSVADERKPPMMSLRAAPTWWFADGRSRLRWLLEIGGWAGTAQDTDPRPQAAPSRAGATTRPVTLEQRRLAMGMAFDLAVALPYPVLRRSARLGRVELRWRPEFQYRREWLDLHGVSRIVERTMLLPLSVGLRWHVSPRQRFTFYVGPRFDVVSFARPDGRGIARGRPNVAPLYGEAWYDIDFAFTEHPRRDHRPRRAMVVGMLSLGYVHSRFDGRGFNFGPVIGFLGPVHMEWTTRIRPVGSRTAFQAAVGAVVGNGLAVTGTLGVSLPDLHSKGRR